MDFIRFIDSRYMFITNITQRYLRCPNVFRQNNMYKNKGLFHSRFHFDFHHCD